MRSNSQAPSAGTAWLGGAAVLAAAVLLLAITASSAFAAPGHPIVRTFSTGPNTGPASITTDSDGYVYVVEPRVARIDKFDSNGNRVPFTSQFGYVGESAITGTLDGLFPLAAQSLGGIAVDSSPGPTHGYIYAVGRPQGPFGPQSVLVFDPSGTYKGTLGQRKDAVCGIAVNPTDGSVYRQNANATEAPVDRYAPPTGIPQRAQPNATLSPTFSCTLAVDASGGVYGGGSSLLKKWDASQFNVDSPVPAFEVEVNARAIAVDPANGDAFVKEDQGLRIFNSAGVEQGQRFVVPGSFEASVAIAPGGNIFTADENGGGIFVYGPDEVDLPTATTEGSSNVDVTTADVEGTVDPAGAGDITTCEIRYGEDSGYSTGSVPCSPTAPISSPAAVSAHLTGLVSGTTYRYRVFVTNANGTQTSSSDQTFTTPAVLASVSTGAATGISKESAVLQGSFEGVGSEAHYFFEWGATTAYGHTTPVPPGDSAGSASGPQEVAPITIGGLHGGTRYHYRLSVSTPAGVTRGQDETFTTAEAVTDLTAEAPTVGTETSVDLRASFTGDGTYETHYYFEWGPTDLYGNISPAPPGLAVPAGTGRIDLPPFTLAGLKKGSTYHYRVVARNATGTSVSNDITFKPAAVPEVEHLDSRAVLANSAELTAEVNPHLAETIYRFEWGPTAAYGNVSPVPDGNAGAAAFPVPVSAKLTGLSPDITYHFRLVATNKFGTSRTVDQTFSFHAANCPNAQLRQETRSNTLPDCRAYELVTPSFAQGTFIFPERGPAAPLASNPARLAYTGNYGTFPAEAGDPSNVVADLYVSTRTDAGWKQKFIGKPANETFLMGGPPGSAVQEFVQFKNSQPLFTGVQASPDLSKLISYELGWPSNVFGQQGKASNAPYVWDTSSGKLLERWPTNLPQVPNGEKFVGWPQASTDTSHFVFQSNLPFAPGGTEVAREITCCSSNEPTPLPPASIYDNNLKTGEVELASIKGDQTTFQGYVFNVSEDGSHILMSEERASAPTEYTVIERIRDVKGPLYLRANGEHTYEIAPGHKIAYAGSAGDGKTVYLRSAEQLTPDDQDNSTDLFVWRQSNEQLTRISTGDAGGNSDECEATWSGGGCNVEAIERNGKGNGAEQTYGGPEGSGTAQSNGYSDNPLATASGDLYFVSPEQLIESRGQEGRANLYVYRNGGLQFVAVMDSEASTIKRIQVSPDGAHMAFVTRSSVTDYDSARHKEMYTYDPQGDRIVCASCRPDGQPPTSDIEASSNGLFQTYDGRVFFSTTESLTARDTNGGQDIYEFTEGKPQLISSGIGLASRGKGFTYGAPTQFIGVTANGSDAYFASIDVLVSQDHNGQGLKIYDARTGGGYPAERTPEKCTAADECHGPGESSPAPLVDRTSANLGMKAKPKAHKAKHKKKKAHKKKQKQRKSKKKAKTARGNGKQGRGTRG